MAYFPQYPGYQSPYYPQPVPDQLAQLRQQQMQQSMMQSMPQTLPSQAIQPQIPPVNQQNSGIIWVNSKQEADNYFVSPGSAMALWDANNPVIYLRQADNTGKPTTKVYDLVERDENQTAKQPAPQVDFSQYVTHDQLEEILAERLKRPSRTTKQKEDIDDG